MVFAENLPSFSFPPMNTLAIFDEQKMTFWTTYFCVFADKKQSTFLWHFATSSKKTKTVDK